MISHWGINKIILQIIFALHKMTNRADILTNSEKRV